MYVILYHKPLLNKWQKTINITWFHYKFSAPTGCTHLPTGNICHLLSNYFSNDFFIYYEKCHY